MKLMILSLMLTAPSSDASVGAIHSTPLPVSPGGIRATTDIPASQHMRNTGGSDGQGLCVFTSVEVASRWHRLTALAGLQDYMKKRPGGGYPEKLDAVLTDFCRTKGIATIGYVQHTGGDDGFLDLAMKTNRIVCITYAGADGFYSGPIAHMVNLIHLDDKYACVVDNNRPGQFIWMTRKELLARWRGMYDDGRQMYVRAGVRVVAVGGGWAVAFLAPPPPPYAVAPKVSANMIDELPPAVGHGVDPDQPLAPKSDNFGVDVARVSSGRRFFLNGVDVPKAAVEAAMLSDDSARYNLFAVGTEAQIAAFLAAAVKLPQIDREKLHIQAYLPTDWQVEQFGLPVGVSVRKPAVMHVGENVKTMQWSGESAPGVDTTVPAVVNAALHPEAVLPPVKPDVPGPPASPEAVVITMEDLKPEAAAALRAKGYGSFSFTLTPIAPVPPPQPMPPAQPPAPKPDVAPAPKAGEVVPQGRR